jgi:hypothetical protein
MFLQVQSLSDNATRDPTFVGTLFEALPFTQKTGSSALLVLSNCIDLAKNQSRTALRDGFHEKLSFTHWMGLLLLGRPTLATFSLLLSTTNAVEPRK